MSIQHKYLKGFFFIVSVMLVSVFACNFGSINEKEYPKLVLNQYYKIEPDSIFESLDQAEKDVFALTDEPIWLPTPPPSKPVNWNQADYFRIAEALHEYVWGETLENWNLYYMSFSLDCNEFNDGFQRVQFKYFTNVKTSDRESRIVHNIELDPRNKIVNVGETVYYPKLINWKTIDLTNVKISASEALQIAEQNGGYNKRLAAGNDCAISATISRDAIEYDGWIVLYSPSVFSDTIDPATGE
jgi:hypothetical protein